jgi:hypothetical protein
MIFSENDLHFKGGPLLFSKIFPLKAPFFHGDVHFKASQNDLLSQGQRHVPGTLLQKCVVASRLPYGDVEMRKYL